MNKRTLTTLLAVLLLICFFLPYLSNGSLSYSGYNVIFGTSDVEGLSKAGRSIFVCLLIPIGAFLLLIGMLTKDSFTSSGFVYWMPLVGAVYIIVMLYLQAESNGGVSISDFFSVFGYGLWLTLIASVILPFSRSNR